MSDSLEIRGISIILTRKKVKNLSLRVLPPDGSVRVTVPLRMKKEDALKFIISKESWIKKQQQKISGNEFNRELSFVEGEEHYLFGKKFTLKLISDSGREGVYVKDDLIILYLKNDSSIEKREKLMENWYRHNLERNIPQLISRWEQRMGVKVNEFRIRKMKTRWGTCNPSKKRIWLSLMLAKRRPALVEYIVVHEMVHLLETGHNKRFYTLMDRFLPGWKDLRKELR